MSDYVDTDDDNGGVHINSGIPNLAFYLTAVALGGRAWSRAGKVWYHALTQTLRRDADFAQAATAIVDAAGTKLGKSAANTVRGAWKKVGIEVRSSTRRTARPKALAGGAQHGGRGRANPRGAERGHRRAS
jgi:Zn-dependent metalloprotease